MMKSKETFNFRIILIMLLLCAASGVSAADSLSCDVQRRCAFDDGHRLRAVDIVVPAALVGVSALYIENGWMVRQKRAVRYALVPKDRRKMHADDYVQYSPVVAVYGLNLAGVRGRHSFKDRTIMLAMSYATMGIIVNTMKLAISERRPDVSTRNSFPSGHTATAFMGAQFLYEEYKSVSPLIGLVGLCGGSAHGLSARLQRPPLDKRRCGGCVHRHRKHQTGLQALSPAVPQVGMPPLHGSCRPALLRRPQRWREHEHDVLVSYLSGRITFMAFAVFFLSVSRVCHVRFAAYICLVCLC